MAIEQTLEKIAKQHGDGAVFKLGEQKKVNVDVISTRIPSLDHALGVGGFPRGRVIEIFGPESSGKTTLTLQVIAEAQSMGGTAAFIDAEHALDPDYARKLGIKVDDLYVSQPDCGEQALQIVDSFTKSGEFSVIVIDSVAALTPRAELEGEMGDNHMGLQARLMNQAMRKLTGNASKYNTTLIFINQLRDKIGVMFGSPETTTGGKALKFYASVRIDIRRIASIKDGETIIGARTRAKVVKNKVAKPFGIAEFDLVYDKGADAIADLFDTAVEMSIIDKAGSWFSYDGERIGQGRAKAVIYLESNKELLDKIKKNTEEIL